MQKFWSMAVRSAEKRTDLYILDEIAEQQSWWGDEVTPKMFKRDIDRAEGTLYVWLDSPGGDVFAGTTIHDMLREYSASGRGRVIAMVSLAASAASIVAMAADEIRISLLGTIMIHEPWSRPQGKSAVLRAVADVLDTVRDAQVEAYTRRTGQPREKIMELLNGPDGNGTYMNARQAIELGFADSIMHDEEDGEDDRQPTAMMKSITEVRIASSLERNDERITRAAMDAAEPATPSPLPDLLAKHFNTGNEPNSAASEGLTGFLAGLRSLARDEAKNDIMDALICGVRAGLDRWDSLQAATDDPEGEDGEGDDDGLEALMAAIEATKDADDDDDEKPESEVE